MVSPFEVKAERQEKKERAESRLAEMKLVKVVRADIRPVKVLNKKLGLTQLHSDKLHNRSIRRFVYGIGLAGAFAYEPVREAYNTAVQSALETLPVISSGGAISTIAYALISASLPLASAYFLGSAAFSQMNSALERDREANMMSNALIKQGRGDERDKYLDDGISYLERKFSAYELTQSELEDIVREHASQYARDRADFGRRLPRAVVQNEANLIFERVRTYSERKRLARELEKGESKPAPFTAEELDEPIIMFVDEAQQR